MRFYCISDNIDTQMGMRLAGIEGVVVHEYDETVSALNRMMESEDVGIILMTEKLIKLCSEVVFDYKLNRKKPLIVEIPDRHGTSQISDSIMRYVREAIGVKI